MSKMKNMIVVRDIKSNLVEEAIIIFKENVKIKEEQKLRNNGKSEIMEKNLKNELCLQEAQNIITEYANSLENRKKENNIKAKMHFLQAVNIALVIATILIAIIK